jgi:hypothetical protein
LENIQRTDSFSLFPAVVAFTAITNQLWRDVAVFKATGKVSLRKQKFNKKEKMAIEKELRKIAKAHKNRFVNRFNVNLGIGAKQVEMMAAKEFGSSQSLEALLFSVVVESWMAFETLVADLFHTALDYGQADWRISVGSKFKEFRGGSNWEPQKIAPSIIHDPQKEYGSYLRDMGAISFQKFREIKFWYKTAFGEDVEKLFRVEGGYIRALSAVRNVILHQGGKADATYIKEVKKFPELSRAEENKLIQLDGEIVRKLRNAAIALGIELISWIDRMITPA